METVAYLAVVAFGLFLVWVGIDSLGQSESHKHNPRLESYFSGFGKAAFIFGCILAGMGIGELVRPLVQ
jgi:hypothetical protein